MASDVGDDLGLDDLVYVTLGIESTIKHDQVRPTLTVYPSPNHETATSPSVLLRNADVSITLTPATPYSDTPITMRETKPGFISKKYSSPVSRSPTKALCHPLEPCSTPMTIQNGTSVRARRPNRLRRLRTVWADIRSLWRPLISLAVTVAGLCLFRRCTRRIWRSCIGKVTEGRPLRGRSLVVPVSCRRCLRRVIVVWDTFKRLAISVGLKPLWSIPTALSLSTLVRRGMTSAIWFCDKLSLWGPANKWLQMFACMRP